ncbi:MAG TPA: hypothetical protein VE996_00885 [Terriglobales bacterium]|nr:hypothetical protein [Terriglobales bacterium]
MRAADWVALCAYFAAMLAVGVRYSRQMRSAEMYFAGGQQLPWWLGGTSFLMSYVSALSIIVYAALGYRYGLVALTLYWTTIPATVLTTWLLAARWRRAGIITPTEFLETRFSASVRQVFVWSGIPLKLIDEGLKIVAIGLFLAAGLHISPLLAMAAVGLVVILYTVLGGLWAVVVTDFIQFTLVTCAVVLLLPLLWHRLGGQAWRALPADLLRPTHAPYGWSYVGAFLVLSTLGLAGNWSLIQKFYSARDDREARATGWMACALFFLLPPFWILTGLLARVAFRAADAQMIYAQVAAALLPPGIFGMVLAALLAATMSVLASGYNVMAAVLTVDVYRRLMRPLAGERELVWMGRWLTAAVGIIVLAIALAVTYFHWTIFDTMVAAFGFFLPPTVLPVLAGLLSRRLSAAGALAGFGVGIAAGAGFLFYQWRFLPRGSAGFQALSIVVPAALTVLVLAFAAVFFPARREAAARANEFFARLGRPASQAPGAGGISPAPMVGTILAAMGVVLALLGCGAMPGAANPLTLGVGLLFLAIGLAIAGFSRRHRAEGARSAPHGA